MFQESAIPPVHFPSLSGPTGRGNDASVIAGCCRNIAVSVEAACYWRDDIYREASSGFFRPLNPGLQNDKSLTFSCWLTILRCIFRLDAQTDLRLLLQFGMKTARGIIISRDERLHQFGTITAQQLIGCQWRCVRIL